MAVPTVQKDRNPEYKISSDSRFKLENSNCISLMIDLTGCLYFLKLIVIMRKTDFCICENKDADQLCSISDFVFAKRLSTIPPILISKNSRILFSLVRPVCVRPGQKS